MRPAKLSGIIALLLTPVVSGCSFYRPHEPLAIQAVGFNLTVEQSQNEMLLLNVIRAKDRLPMYLTAISSLSGNANVSVTGELGGSYSHQSAMTKTITRGLTPSVGGTLSRNPNFTLAVLDGQDFTRGFLSPIDQRTFAYFWDQGWPKELLMYLLVQKVELRDGGRPYVNYPDPEEPDLATLQRYGSWVEAFVAGDPELVLETTCEPVGGPIEGPLQDPTKLMAANKEGFVVETDGTEWRMYRVRKTYRLHLPRAGDEASADPRTAAQGRTPEGECTRQEKLRRADDRGAGEPRGPESLGVSLLPAADEVPTQFSDSDGRIHLSRDDGSDEVVVLRSPEAILYYLGELMRVANREGDSVVPEVCIQDRFRPLFVAYPAERCDRHAVEARSPWGAFEIPRSLEDGDLRCGEKGALRLQPVDSTSCDPGRSMQAFRLLSQLISLQKSAEELPSPALVRVIGE